MKTEYYISLCIALQCGIMGIQWYKNDVLLKEQHKNEQLLKTNKHLLNKKKELEQEITTNYDTIKQFATNQLQMAPIKSKQIRALPC